MRELEHKQRVRRKMYSTPALIVLGIVVLVLAKGAYGVVNKMLDSKARVAELREKVENLKDRQAELESGISKLQTEEGVDSEIKGKFSVSKEGEQVAVIVDARNEATTTAPKKESLLSKMWKTLTSLWQ